MLSERYTRDEIDDLEHRRFIYEELQKSKIEASDPNVVLYSTDEVFAEVFQILESRGL